MNDKSRCYNLLKKKKFTSKTNWEQLARKTNSINKWIQTLLTNKKKYDNPCDHGPLCLQYDFVYINNKKSVSKVFKFEDYKNSLTTLLENINRKDLINKIEKTNHSYRDNNEKLSNKTIDMIYNYFKKDFITFNYDKKYNIY